MMRYWLVTTWRLARYRGAYAGGHAVRVGRARNQGDGSGRTAGGCLRTHRGRLRTEASICAHKKLPLYVQKEAVSVRTETFSLRTEAANLLTEATSDSCDKGVHS